MTSTEVDESDFEDAYDGMVEDARELQRSVARLVEAARDSPILSKYHGHRGFEVDRFIADYSDWQRRMTSALAPFADGGKGGG